MQISALISPIEPDRRMCTGKRSPALRRPASRVLRLCSSDHGGSLPEFAFSALTLILVVFAVFEFSMLLYTYTVLGEAAREGIRYAVVHGTDSATCSGPSTGCGDSTGNNIKSVVTNYAAESFHDTSAMVVTPSWPDSSSQPGQRVRVQITYTYIPYITIPGNVTPTMSLSAEGRIVF